MERRSPQSTLKVFPVSATLREQGGSGASGFQKMNSDSDFSNCDLPEIDAFERIKRQNKQ